MIRRTSAALAALVAIGVGFAAPGVKASDATDGIDIRMSIAAVESARPTGLPDFRVTIENTGDKDFMVNLGFMLANGKVMVPEAIRLVLTDAQGESRVYRRKGLWVGGRMDDFVVPLAAGSRYGLRLNLDDYVTGDAMESALKLKPGEYRIRAELDAKGAQCLNNDTEGMALMNHWIGKLESDAVAFRIATPK